ncbi:hypothetical protein BH11PLA2_BH11PLA2_37920 [soil metagenome]
MTPMHFQYLAGLCCLRCNPDAMEMILGDRVLDESTGTCRDVDVTITINESGNRTAFMGFEAKMESGPLDVSKVEQLCAKLNDMPGFTTRAIVSASGYSKTAIQKAKKHNIKLYTFQDWQGNVSDSFPKLTLEGPPQEAIGHKATHLKWLDPVSYRLILREKCGDCGPLEPDRDSTVQGVDGRNIGDIATLDQLIKHTIQYCTDNIKHDKRADAVLMQPLPYPPYLEPDGPKGEPIVYDNIICQLSEPAYILAHGKLHEVVQIELSGKVQWHMTSMKAEYRILTDTDGGPAFAGAAIATYPPQPNFMIVTTIIADSTFVGYRLVHLTEKQMNFISQLTVLA